MSFSNPVKCRFLLGAGARAQAAWPSRPIQIIDVYAPGGSTDTMARMPADGTNTRHTPRFPL